MVNKNFPNYSKEKPLAIVVLKSKKGVDVSPKEGANRQYRRHPKK